MKKFRLPVVMCVACLTAIGIVALYLGYKEVTIGCVTAIGVISPKVIESDEKTTNGE